TVTGNLTNGAVINVGDSSAAGTLTVNGNYTQSAGGVLNLKIGGPNPGSDYDQLRITGQATLDGTLHVALINGFSPNPRDGFQVLTFAGAAGSFATTDLPSGASFTLNSTDGTVSF